jgi:hypothetical protein
MRETHAEDTHVLVLGGEEGDSSLADGILELADLVQDLQTACLRHLSRVVRVFKNSEPTNYCLLL